MSNSSKEIKVNRALGKSANLFFIPEQYIYPFSMLTGVMLLVYWAVSYVLPSVDEFLFIGIWLTLLLTYSLFYGKQPWKLGGGFHEAPNWILSYAKFDPTQPQFKAKKKPVRRVGYGTKSRKVQEFEKKLHASCLVEICSGWQKIGAYLLEKDHKYRLVFVFGFTGIRSNLDEKTLEAIIDALQEGLKDLRGGESVVFRCGNFADNQNKVNELNWLKKSCNNPRVKYLMKALKLRFDGLLQSGKFNQNSCYIECSYTLDDKAIKGEDLVEQIFVGIQELAQGLTGKKKQSRPRKIQAFIEESLSGRVYILARVFRIQTEAKRLC